MTDTPEGFLHPIPRDQILKKRYGSGRWRRLSTLVRERDGRCMVKVSKKCSGRAEVADHIVRPEEGGALYDLANLRASCRSCNFQRHNAAYFREKADAQHGALAVVASESMPPKPRTLAYAYHHHRTGSAIGYVLVGNMSIPWAGDGCPPGCTLPPEAA